ncbi:hypothetical protein H5410_044259 [Solanum commersonii]|uniref:Pectinesterase inhibitor domain-containing protein n=1 Tax=Solanum commersonii TaxID=4109 RepID=A0A9J5X6A3_SOLCO|nr:hypothetical protein H5410_044259 [Solanum commersonii]
MGRSISILILFLPYIFLCNVEFFACNFSTVRSFCFDVSGNDENAQSASTKTNLEFIVIDMARANYTNIHRKVLTIDLNKTNPEYKHVYRMCLHEYVVLKSYFEDILNKVTFSGDLGRTALEASNHLFTCMLSFIRSPNIPNPFVQDNENLQMFFDLLRDIYVAPL